MSRQKPADFVSLDVRRRFVFALPKREERFSTALSSFPITSPEGTGCNRRTVSDGQRMETVREVRPRIFGRWADGNTPAQQAQTQAACQENKGKAAAAELRCCCGTATCAPEEVEQQNFAVALEEMERRNRIVVP
jgi:hypothetical protein